LARRFRPRNAEVSAGSARCAVTPALVISSTMYRQPVQPSIANATGPAVAPYQATVRQRHRPQRLGHPARQRSVGDSVTLQSTTAQPDGVGGWVVGAPYCAARTPHPARDPPARLTAP